MWDLSFCSPGPCIGLVVEAVAVEALSWGALSSRCVAGSCGLIRGCSYPSPADDRPRLDPAGRVLLPRPVEHPGLRGGGWRIGGLCFGVSVTLSSCSMSFRPFFLRLGLI